MPQNEPDYMDLTLPDNTDYKNWRWQQRRAYILQEILNRGHPGLIKQRDMAHKFGVSDMQISKDMKKLRRYLRDNMAREHEAVGRSIFEKATKGLMEKGKYKDAADVYMKWQNWLYNRGEVEKTPDKKEVEVSGSGITVELLREMREEAEKEPVIKDFDDPIFYCEDCETRTDTAKVIKKGKSEKPTCVDCGAVLEYKPLN